MWLSTVTVEGAGRDRDVRQILQQADEIAADRMLEALGLRDEEARPRLHAMMIAYGGLVKAASRQWLVDQSLTRDEVHALLTRTLLVIVRDVAPLPAR
jgi:hypothetical protein